MRTLLVLLLAISSAFGADKWDLSEAQAQEIIKKFAAQETAFATAREKYTYRQTARLLELDEFGNTQGRWEEVIDVIFSANRQRSEKVQRAPVQSLKNIIMTPEDLQDLRSVMPFVLTTSEIDQYNIRYLGHEVLDEVGCYAFAVKPKKMEQGQRYFSGIVWVDDRDTMVVRTYGRAVGLLKTKGQQFPKFTTYREQIDKKFWFPTYTIAEDVLVFDTLAQRIRSTVKYEDYKTFGADVGITFGDVVDTPKPEAPKKP
jgi:hypothetical protein